MASSSHSKAALPYEVFISFRGEDTRNNFVSHLHSALVDRGIRTYLDTQNLNHGQTIKPKLLKAIEESSIAIVVLSTHYGSSTWCLGELVKIMDCKNKSGLHVIPIFYNIDPSDVRKQKNSFFQAFSDHEKNYKDETVKIWRNALKEVADLVGEDTRGKNELSCIKNIADKILSQLPVKASGFRKAVVGIESRISDIKKLMYSKTNEVLFIGIWGMGGIGKTTTARAIFEDCKNEFEGSCFLDDVKISNNKLKELQERLLSTVLKTKVEGLCDTVEGSSIIHERLQCRKVMLVIDDVDDIEQLKALAKECDWFGTGSVIIITTRDEHLLDDDYVRKYNIQTLAKNEALHLFSLHAFKNDHPPKDYEDVALQVLRYAGGLPLALRVLGDHLYRRKISFWESTLIRLKDVPEDKIISKLQISFDGLNVFQQDIFLNIACFFRGFSRYVLERQLQVLGLHPEEGIDVLLQRSLIYCSEDFDMEDPEDFDMEDPQDFDTEDLIEMHDLLQEMGWHIVRQRANYKIERYSRLWLEEDILKVLSDITVSSEVEGICIKQYTLTDQWKDILSRLNWEAAFRKMNKLSFLKLNGMLFGGISDVIVPQSSGEFYNYNLRWLSVRHYNGQSLPKSFRPMNLVHLSLFGSNIIETPDFNHMPNLEKLDLHGSKSLVHVHPSLGTHMKIKRVYLTYCSKLDEFPEINQMESLEILDLSYTNIKRFPETYGKLDSLRELMVSAACINGLTTSIVCKVTALEILDDLRHLRGSQGLRWPYYEAGKSFPGLVSLQITHSALVRTLDFSHLPYLEKLDLSDSSELAEVHASLGVHKKIKTINLAKCSNLFMFPRMIDMNSLEDLDLSVTSLYSFPEIYGNLDSLRKLNLLHTYISGLPTSILGNATGLQELELACQRPYNEEEFTSLEAAKCFPGLVSLQITHSAIVRTLDFSHLPYLEKLDLSGSHELAEVHTSLGVHKTIKYINLAKCSNLVEFPRMIDMNSLEELDLSSTSLKRFPEIYGNLDSLRKLNVRKTSINGLPTSIPGNATALQQLKLACRRPYNEEFTSLDVVKSFPGLVSLQVTGSGIVRTLDFSHLPYLKSLDLSGSHELADVHASLGVHKGIKTINLANCPKLVEFPRIIDMNSLEKLDLSSTSLKRFPEIYGNLDSLMNLHVRDTSINGLPTSIPGNATALQQLKLACRRPYNEEFTSLDVVKSFPGLVSLQVTGSGIVRTLDFSHLPYLKSLDLSGSHELAEVHASLGVHKGIKTINLANCPKLVEFPRIIDMNSLKELDLSSTSLKRFPEIYGNLDSLMNLDVRDTSINGLPTSIVGNATCLRKLRLKLRVPYHEEFTSLEVVKSFPGLVSLQVTGSGIVRTLDFSHLPYLEKLDLSGSAKLAEVHASLGVHKRIKSINLAHCSKVVDFPRMIDMNSLEELDLSFTSLKSFPEMTGNVDRLGVLRLDYTEITTLPWSIRSATGLTVISMIGCEFLLTLPISFLGLQLQIVDISSGALKYFTENIDDETAQAVELHSSQEDRRKQLIVSKGLHIKFNNCGSLKELPEPLLARVISLTIEDCPSLTSWICCNLVDLLDKYQDFGYLQLHQKSNIYPHDVLQVFSEWELVSNMLRKREKPFVVHVPGSQIPSWFQYQINWHSATAFVPPLAEWDTHNLKGFVLSGTNAVLSTSDDFNSCYAGRQQFHILIMYIPIDDMKYWQGRNKCTLFELTSLQDWGIEIKDISSWGLSLVYSKDIVNEDKPCEVLIVMNDDDAYPGFSKFRVKTLQSKDGNMDDSNDDYDSNDDDDSSDHYDFIEDSDSSNDSEMSYVVNII